MIDSIGLESDSPLVCPIHCLYEEENQGSQEDTRDDLQGNGKDPEVDELDDGVSLRELRVVDNVLSIVLRSSRLDGIRHIERKADDGHCDICCDNSPLGSGHGTPSFRLSRETVEESRRHTINKNFVLFFLKNSISHHGVHKVNCITR
jgi:hypothetical protein